VLSRVVRIAIAVATALIATTVSARAHSGPPYPILVDQRAGPYRMSVWADPDIGVGTFFVYLESPDATPLPDTCHVEVRVRLAGSAEPGVVYPARLKQVWGGPRQYLARVRFETRQTWSVRFVVSSSAGTGEAESIVASTPPGAGPILDFVLYLFPFVAVGALFVMAALRRRPAAKPGSTPRTRR
jgi:hypothetical protein